MRNTRYRDGGDEAAGRLGKAEVALHVGTAGPLQVVRPIACAIDPEHHGCRPCPLGVDEPAPDDAAALLHPERFHRTVALRSTNGYRLGFRLLAGTPLSAQLVALLDRFFYITR